ncbi:FAD-dependent oxidoreductase [Silvanigrella aquatica]|uniref:FAD dependent oxidoreductase domain-containing protein n=1 Tax=Silvanigrella aquatica TaxID=1915309 RepID=A0A1L4D352_9BACT|nr:FAD-dependent oxidoreductase [Silvanigrella aquatica]APJ04621.1 hypothetical protein AXG55_12195 [Silvanigrella aquatica]
MSEQEFDVAVVGAGVFSCFSALLLAQEGLKIGLIYPEKTELLGSFFSSLRTCWPSLNDPPTRAEVAHGHEVALYLHEFCSKGIAYFQHSLLPLIGDNSNWISSSCLRISTKDFETDELEDAFKLGFGLKKTELKNVYLEENNSLICKNPEEFQNTIYQALQRNNVHLISSAAVKINETQSSCSIEFKNHPKINCEIAVLGNTLNISKLLPRYEKILIPMSDTLFEYHCKSNIAFPSISFRAANGHVCATFFSNHDDVYLKISGPRFLLPGAGAGIDLTNSHIDEKVFQNIEKYHSEILFGIIQNYLEIKTREELLSQLPLSLVSKKILVDCYPCDELPVVGEFGKLGRILGNTGWLATGFSAGFWAAKIIKELVLNEKSVDLHSRLQPRRLFTSFVKTK